MLLSHITFTTAKITGTRHRTASHAVCLSVTSPQAEKAPAKWFLLPFCQRPVLRCYCCYCFSAVISVSFRPERRSPPFRPVSDRHCLPDQTQWVPALLGQSFHFRPESFHLQKQSSFRPERAAASASSSSASFHFSSAILNLHKTSVG